MNKDEYIHSLENLLIFMCRTYEERTDILLELGKRGNDAFMHVPTIQGTVNVIAISQLADMEFQEPKHGFQDVQRKLQEERT